jgi:hypothetical protein
VKRYSSSLQLKLIRSFRNAYWTHNSSFLGILTCILKPDRTGGVSTNCGLLTTCVSTHDSGTNKKAHCYRLHFSLPPSNQGTVFPCCCSYFQACPFSTECAVGLVESTVVKSVVYGALLTIRELE